jgi:hypothetical protein
MGAGQNEFQVEKRSQIYHAGVPFENTFLLRKKNPCKKKSAPNL